MTAKAETSDELWARVETAIGYGPGRSRCLAAVRAYAEALARKRAQEALLGEYQLEGTLCGVEVAAIQEFIHRCREYRLKPEDALRARILEEKSC